MPDLFWEEIRKKGWNSYFTETVNSIDEIEIIIIRTKTDFNKSLFSQFPNLKMIIRAGSGFDNIDIHEAQNRNVIVCNTPEANAFSAYEHTLSFIIALIKQHQICKEQILQNKWKADLEPNWEISDLKVMIVGVGRVGSRVAETLVHLGAQIKGCDPYLSEHTWRKKQLEETSYLDGLKWCNMITFHCPLTAETENYFKAATLKDLQNPVWLINTSRGKVIQESAISQGLVSGKILGFASDVFPQEPWKIQNFAAETNVFLTPHVGSFTERAKIRLAKETLDVWSDYVNHCTIRNRVN